MALKKSDIRAIVKNEDATVDEKISEILDIMHSEIDGVKDKADEIRAEKEELQAEIEKLKADNATSTNDWKEKFEAEQKAFADYKEAQEAKATKDAINDAYRKLLKDAGVSEKRIDTVMKVTDIASLSLDDEGKLVDADKHTESIKAEWADFIAKSDKDGAQTHTPPTDNNVEKTFEDMSMEEYIKARKK